MLFCYWPVAQCSLTDLRHWCHPSAAILEKTMMKQSTRTDLYTHRFVHVRLFDLQVRAPYWCDIMCITSIQVIRSVVHALFLSLSIMPKWHGLKSLFNGKGGLMMLLEKVAAKLLNSSCGLISFFGGQGSVVFSDIQWKDKPKQKHIREHCATVS